MGKVPVLSNARLGGDYPHYKFSNIKVIRRVMSCGSKEFVFILIAFPRYPKIECELECKTVYTRRLIDVALPGNGPISDGYRKDFRGISPGVHGTNNFHVIRDKLRR